MIGQAGASSAARASALARARDERERDDGARFSLDDAEPNTPRRPAVGEGESAGTARPRRREDEELRAAPASGAHPDEARPTSDAEAANARALGQTRRPQVGQGIGQGGAEAAVSPADGQGDASLDAATFAMGSAADGDAAGDEAALALPEGGSVDLAEAAPEVSQGADAEAKVAVAAASTDVDAPPGIEADEVDAADDGDDLDALTDAAQDTQGPDHLLSGKDRLELSAHRLDALRPAARAPEGTLLADRLAEAAHRTLAETHDTSNVLRFRAESHTFTALVNDGTREVRFNAESAATRAFIAERIAEVRGELHRVGQPASVSLATDTDGQRQRDARQDRADADPQAGLDGASRPVVKARTAAPTVAPIDDPDHLHLVL